jgi:two-component system sensor histidine kinase HydH
MLAETLEKLWTPLFTTKARGMGFGLAICKRNVEAHGGKIGVESKTGEGTVVRVKLPLGYKN